ncbi:hypothetical protein LTR36_001867 [Oleoguttula mirabilis]|uniref:Uncharacterized protein n=1 Tax=Oleoguttula mirabilis TaxID=1507867 RepID=A0AAV9JM92_9PEZI|nr:hypothetical protein LTR36_001867 [Oleoguttula mirabilis]
MAGGNTGIHISIIDIKRLGKRNIVLPISAAKLIADKVSYFEYEYFAFGKISGPARKALSYDTLLSHGINQLSSPDTTWDFFPARYPDTKQRRLNGLETDLDYAHSVGNAFGSGFALAVATNIMAGRKRNADELGEIVEYLSKFSVPDEWRGDPVVGSEELDLGHVREAQRAEHLRRLMVEHADAPSGHKCVALPLEIDAGEAALQDEDAKADMARWAKHSEVHKRLTAGMARWNWSWRRW